MCEPERFYHHSQEEQFEFMQLVGIKDVKDKDVWEGDIVKVGIGNEFGSMTWDLGVVEYQGERAAFIIKKVGSENLMTRIESENNGRPNFEVIGNVWENPELLK